MRQSRENLKTLVHETISENGLIKGLLSDVDVLKADVSVLKADVSVLKADVSVLKADVSVLKADVGMLKRDVFRLCEGFHHMGLKMDELNSKLDRALEIVMDSREIKGELKSLRGSQQLTETDLGLQRKALKAHITNKRLHRPVRDS